MFKAPAVYIVTNKRNGTLYIGVTSNLVQRIWQHRQHEADGFTAKYDLHRLIYFESHSSMYDAITREKQLKRWKRDWKIRLIEEFNPHWQDLWNDII
ncbi:MULTISPECIES: GIY-YIG nuclease family protein [Oceanimonas]|uniref:GIY-YIG nuclease n=1 Tax=Oceanimonas doudoroffii TaxID=84158 RepID=A0A233RFH3_9GAMM|nr:MULTISPECIES: GIY-YIG nuclease family protein [Oceanimonas]NHI01630.1 hypothetical protein [Oceanimonas sp. MB9]OXY82129.1 GIY-YIG nuclease [Oceanimonas doudoroffii]